MSSAPNTSDPAVVTEAQPGPDAAAGSDPVLLAAAIALPLALAGCGGGGGGGGQDASTQPALTFTAIALTVITDDVAAAIQIDAANAGAGGRVRFALDGQGGSTSRTRDPGARRTTVDYDFAVSASSTAGTAAAECYVSINPAPERHLDSADPVVQRLRHLFNRIGFGPGEAELARWMNVDYATAVGRIVDESDYGLTLQDPPSAATFHQLSWRELSHMTTAEQKAYNDSKGSALQQLNAWWWREIIRTPQPLLERMALFWHGLLVVAEGDVFEPKPMWGYLDLLRTHALGSFRDLLHGIAREPAMVLFLNSSSNVKGRPNENFARELMELFTLGEGQVYTEADVVQVAKCFTGWNLTERAAFQFRQDYHEPGVKTVFSTPIANADADPEQVRLDGEAVIDLILAQNRVAIYLCGRLWDEFIGGTRDDAVIASWATTFRGAGDYDIRRVLKAVFTSAAFTDSAQRGNMLRSPVELHAMVWRTIGLEPGSYDGQHWAASSEDQTLLSPPNVRGWVGGLQWISAKTLLDRRTHMGWIGWELTDPDNWRGPPLRLDGIIEQLWFAAPVVHRAYVDAAASDAPWDPRGTYIRRLLADPALNCK